MSSSKVSRDATFSTLLFLLYAILKKTSVSGVAAGWFKKVRMGTFFHFCKKKIKGGGGGNAASLLASKKDTRWTGNRISF